MSRAGPVAYIHGVNVPTWAQWGLLAMAAVGLLGVFSALRTVRGAHGARRTDARLALVDAVAGVVLCVSLAFGRLTLFLCVLAVQGPLFATQLIRSFRRRREPAPDGLDPTAL